MLDAGHSVIGFQRSPAPEFERAGGTIAETARELIDNCALVFLVLPSSEALRAVVGNGEDEGLAASSPPAGAVVADLSTIDFGDKLEAREALRQIGVGMLDCPVSGMPAPDRRPPLDTMFASGDHEDFARCESALRLVASNLHYVGAFGNGLTIKLVANTLVSIHTAAAAEALGLGVRAGLDKDQMVRILTSSPATSWVLEDRAGRMVHGDHQPARASVELLLKDLGIIRDLATRTGTPLPTLDAAVRSFEAARGQGWGDHDVSVVYRLAAEAVSVDPPPSED